MTRNGRIANRIDLAGIFTVLPSKCVILLSGAESNGLGGWRLVTGRILAEHVRKEVPVPVEFAGELLRMER